MMTKSKLRIRVIAEAPTDAFPHFIRTVHELLRAHVVRSLLIDKTAIVRCVWRILQLMCLYNRAMRIEQCAAQSGYKRTL